MQPRVSWWRDHHISNSMHALQALGQCISPVVGSTCTAQPQKEPYGFLSQFGVSGSISFIAHFAVLRLLQHCQSRLESNELPHLATCDSLCSAAPASQAEGSGAEPDTTTQHSNDTADRLFSGRHHSPAAAEALGFSPAAEHPHARRRRDATTSTAEPTFDLFGQRVQPADQTVSCPRCGHSFELSTTRRNRHRGKSHHKDDDASVRAAQREADMPKQEGFRAWLSRFRGPAAEQRA